MPDWRAAAEGDVDLRPENTHTTGRQPPATGDAAPADFPPEYHVRHLIAQTRLSRTWKVEHRDSRAPLVLKEPLESVWRDPDALERFRVEVRLAAKLWHPNIVPIATPHLHEYPYFYTMPFVEGRPLNEYCQQVQPTLRDRVRLFLKIARAVAYAHQHGVMHRDLKPLNILVDSDGEPQLLDFGLGRALGGDEPQPAGVTEGTPPYMSPEQATGLSGDVRDDVYSLGVVLYELLTGSLPIAPANDEPLAAFLERVRHEVPEQPRSQNAGIDRELDAIVTTALAKHAAKRYQSVSDLARDVAAWLDQQPISVVRHTSLYLARKWVRRHKLLTGSGLIVVLGVITSMLYGSAMWSAREAERHTKNVWIGRVQIVRDDPWNAERLLWQEHLSQPTLRTRYALWEFFLRYPLVYHVAGGGRSVQVSYSRDSHWLATLDLAADDRASENFPRITIYDAATGQVVQHWTGGAARPTAANFARQDELLVVGTEGGQVQVVPHDPETGHLLPGKMSMLTGATMSSPVSFVRTSEDDRWLAAGDVDGQVFAWYQQTPGGWEMRYHWRDVGKVVSGLAFFHASALAATCSAGGPKVTAWQLTDGAALGQLELTSPARGVAWESPNRLLTAVGGIGAWTLGDSLMLLKNELHWGVRAIALPAAGQPPDLVAACGDGRLRFLDLRDSTWRNFRGFHHNTVADHMDACFSPDSRYVASAARDGLRVWDYAARRGVDHTANTDER